MKPDDAPEPFGVHSQAGSGRLHGWRLIVARVITFSFVAVTVGLGLVALVNWRRLAVPCGNPLNTCLMSPDQVRPLARLGLTPTSVTLGIVALCCAAVALTNGVAFLLFWRRSDDAMALLVGLTLVLMPAFFTPMFQALTGPWRSVAGVVNVLGGICFLLLILLFPSGHFVPRWIWAPLLGIVLFAAGGKRLPDFVVLLGILVGVLCIVGGQIYRYRVMSTSTQRQQTKWALTGIILAIVVNQLFWQPEGWIPALQRKDSLYDLLVYPDFVVLISILAICFGVAIVRFRLYDIDIIIRRTLIYGVLTAILAAVYFAGVLTMQELARRLSGQSGQQPIIIVATTLLVVALFTPLRRRIQAFIDRAFYRSRYDATRTLSAFGATLREETNLEDLRERLIEVVQQTMQPDEVSLWLRTMPNAASADTHFASERHGESPR